MAISRPKSKVILLENSTGGREVAPNNSDERPPRGRGPGIESTLLAAQIPGYASLCRLLGVVP